MKLRCGPCFYIPPPKPRVPCQTTVERNAPYRAGPINRHTPGRAVIERDETATIQPSLQWEPWQNVAEREKTWKDREMPGNTHASRPSTDRLQDLLRTVTFSCVHPVLLRPTRFLIRTVTAVANLLTV